MKEKFLTFMTSMAGRGAKIILGLLISSLGFFVVGGTIGTIMIIVSLLPIISGLSDFCVAGFAMGYPLKGAEARAKLSEN